MLWSGDTTSEKGAAVLICWGSYSNFKSDSCPCFTRGLWPLWYTHPDSYQMSVSMWSLGCSHGERGGGIRQIVLSPVTAEGNWHSRPSLFSEAFAGLCEGGCLQMYIFKLSNWPDGVSILFVFDWFRIVLVLKCICKHIMLISVLYNTYILPLRL